MNTITIEIYDLINSLQEFFDGNNNVFDIGEMIGCNTLRFVFNEVIDRYTFNNILFVSGIQDEIYSGNNKPNHIYWKTLFNDYHRYSIIYHKQNPFHTCLKDNRRYESYPVINTRLLNKYSCMIINQAQMIPHDNLDILTNAFSKKIVRIFDPFDVFGADYDIPIRCTDTFEKLSKKDGFARYLYGVDTRYIDKSIKNFVNYNVKVTKRGVGKYDNNQYITNDPELYSITQERQKLQRFRRNQKLIIDDNRYIKLHDVDYPNDHIISDGTLLHVIGCDNHPINPSIKARIHTSTAEIILHTAYDVDPFKSPDNVLRVYPGNILDIRTASKHRFKHIVYVTTKDYPSLSIREQYTLMKISDNITIANLK